MEIPRNQVGIFDLAKPIILNLSTIILMLIGLDLSEPERCHPVIQEAYICSGMVEEAWDLIGVRYISIFTFIIDT